MGTLRCRNSPAAIGRPLSQAGTAGNGCNAVVWNSEWTMSHTVASLSEAGVQRFFTSYRAAFEQSDAAAIAGHFAYPCHITSDAGEIVLMPIAEQRD